VAATEAKALDDNLAHGLHGLASRFYARTSKIIDIPWLIATGEDLRYPQVEGQRPPGSSRLPSGSGTPWGIVPQSKVETMGH